MKRLSIAIMVLLVGISFSPVHCFSKTPVAGFASENSQTQNATQPAAQAAPPTVKKQAVPAPAASSVASTDPVLLTLREFASKTIDSMNRCVLPNISKKEVVPNTNGGGFVARYLVVNPDTLQASYKPAQSKALQYVGTIRYQEIEYVCYGKTKQEALAGPFAPSKRKNITELIKYQQNKWSY